MTDPTQWVIVWETDDGPEVDGPYESEQEATLVAFEEWRDWGGGIVGGFSEGSLAEFESVYAETYKLWIRPLGKSTSKGVTA